jgi:hypothetical protein
MKLFGTTIAIAIGVIASGICAVWGACLTGHQLNAGYPFPDIKAIMLFLSGAVVVPLLVAGCIKILRNYLSPRLDSNRLLLPVAILFFAPLVSLAVGISAQHRDNLERNKRDEFYARQKESYSRFAAQVSAEPSIVLSDRWYEDFSDDDYAKVSARRMVFEDSFRPDRLVVPYTGELLRGLSTKARDKSLFVVSHPNCPPDLIESMWSAVLASREAWLIGAMIDNPATPRQLFEAYQAERLKANRAVSGWIDREIERRIEETEQGVTPQSATRSESDSEGDDKPQPESEPRPR